MNKLIIIFFLSPIVVMLSASVCIAQSADFLNIPRRVDHTNQSLKSLKADLEVAESSSVIGGEPLVSSSSIIMKRIPNKSPLIRYEAKSTATVISIIEDKFVLYSPDKKQAFTGKQQYSALAKLIQDWSSAKVKSLWDITYIREDKLGDQITWQLRCIPKSRGTSEVFDV